MRADHPRVINFITAPHYAQCVYFVYVRNTFIPDPGRAGQLECNPPY